MCVCVHVHAQSCPAVCNPKDCSPQDSSVRGIFQTRILERVARSYSRDLPNPGIELVSPVSPALAGDSFTTEPPGKPREGEVKGKLDIQGIRCSPYKLKLTTCSKTW